MKQEEKQALATLREYIESADEFTLRPMLTAALDGIIGVIGERDRWASRVKALEGRIDRAVERLIGKTAPGISGRVVARCAECGGSNVECYAWVRPNDCDVISIAGEYVYDDAAYAAKVGASWCDDCASHTVLRWGA